MAEKKKYLLRLDAGLYNALEKWAADELRSVNAQMEFVLSEAIKQAGRSSSRNTNSEPDTTPSEDTPS